MHFANEVTSRYRLLITKLHQVFVQVGYHAFEKSSTILQRQSFIRAINLPDSKVLSEDLWVIQFSELLMQVSLQLTLFNQLRLWCLGVRSDKDGMRLGHYMVSFASPILRDLELSAIKFI